MSFLQLVRREMHGSLPKLLVMSGLGGISTAAILAAINAGLQSGSSLWAATLFMVALFLFIKTQSYVTITTTAEIEAIIHKIRMRLMDQIRRSELLSIEDIGRSRIVAAITQRYGGAHASEQHALLYGAGRSPDRLCGNLRGVFIRCGDPHDHRYRLDSGNDFPPEESSSGQRETEGGGMGTPAVRPANRLPGRVQGGEAQRARSADLFDDAVDVSRTAANIKIKSQAETFKMIVTSQISMYVLLGAVVFVAPQFSDTLGGAALTKTTTALMFIVGACFGLVQSIPILLNANASADRIEQLENALRATVSLDEPREIPIAKRFDKIEMRKIRFRYVDKFSETAFKIGPIDFTLRPGELVFITGGNGSGKSTFLRVLSGLYPPDSGEIILDGKRINDNTPRRVSRVDVGDFLRLSFVPAALRDTRAGARRSRSPAETIPVGRKDRID